MAVAEPVDWSVTVDRPVAVNRFARDKVDGPVAFVCFNHDDFGLATS